MPKALKWNFSSVNSVKEVKISISPRLICIGNPNMSFSDAYIIIFNYMTTKLGFHHTSGNVNVLFSQKMKGFVPPKPLIKMPVR